MVAPMTEQQFGKAIRAAVVEACEARASIAERAGCAESTIRAIEGGKCPSVVRADRLLRALGVRLLLGDPAGPTLEID